MTIIKERPILFSDDMVQAIIDGKKTMTRRITGLDIINESPEEWNVALRIDGGGVIYSQCYNLFQRDKNQDETILNIKSSYGQIGDRLLVSYNHMPRWASPITLEITNIRIERVQDISDEDAKAEGVRSVTEFKELWESIKGKESWELNPWVWVIEFKVIEPDIIRQLTK